MNNVANVLAIVLLVVLGATAVFDLIRHPKALAATEHLQIPASAVPVLGAVKILLGVGVAVGFGNIRAAELTGLCLCVYFAVATLTHVRVKDTVKGTAPAFVLLVVSGLYLLATVAK